MGVSSVICGLPELAKRLLQKSELTREGFAVGPYAGEMICKSLGPLRRSRNDGLVLSLIITIRVRVMPHYRNLECAGRHGVQAPAARQGSTRF
jgi:hypothetical protein